MASSILESATNKAAVRRLLRHPGTRIGGILLGGILLAATAAPLLSRYDPVHIAPALRLQGPSAAHLLGTDMYGRDTLTRVLYGGRLSLAVGICSVGLALAGGGLLGTLAGFWGRWSDALMMRISDVVLAFPAILLAIALLAFLGGGFWNVVLAIAIVYSAPLIVESTLRLAFAILAEAALSFLGLGTQPPAPSWGQMIAEGRTVMTFSVWPAIGPGMAITATVLGFNLLGDAIRDAMDPHQGPGR